MAALYPKKTTPFNATAARNFEKLNLSPGMYTEINSQAIFRPWFL